jgi:hypothetical protein
MYVDDPSPMECYAISTVRQYSASSSGSSHLLRILMFEDHLTNSNMYHFHLLYLLTAMR